MKTKLFVRNLCKAFSMTEVLILAALIAVVAVFGVPFAVKARSASYKRACLANLKQIEGAKEAWVIEAKFIANQPNTNRSPSDSDLYGPTRYIRDKLACPANGFYTYEKPGIKATCSYAGHTL